MLTIHLIDKLIPTSHKHPSLVPRKVRVRRTIIAVFCASLVLLVIVDLYHIEKLVDIIGPWIFEQAIGIAKVGKELE